MIIQNISENTVVITQEPGEGAIVIYPGRQGSITPVFYEENKNQIEALITRKEIQLFTAEEAQLSYNELSDKPTINGTKLEGEVTIDVGTSNYEQLNNKPTIDGVPLTSTTTSGDLNLVTANTEQDIVAIKTFKTDTTFEGKLKVSATNATQNPGTSTIEANVTKDGVNNYDLGLILRDGDKVKGYIGNAYYSDGTARTSMGVFDDSNIAQAMVGVNRNADGTSVATATQPKDVQDDEIATIRYVKDKAGENKFTPELTNATENPGHTTFEVTAPADAQGNNYDFGLSIRKNDKSIAYVGTSYNSDGSAIAGLAVYNQEDTPTTISVNQDPDGEAIAIVTKPKEKHLSEILNIEYSGKTSELKTTAKENFTASINEIFDKISNIGEQLSNFVNETTVDNKVQTASETLKSYVDNKVQSAIETLKSYVDTKIQSAVQTLQP